MPKDLASKYQKKYGATSASGGRFRPHLKVTSTGILSLDMALGIGGWPEGVIIEVYGPKDIGKSSVVGLCAIVEAQKEGKNCGVIALEPGFDPKWAEKHGVDLDKLIVTWPDNGKVAFDMLYDMVNDPDIGLILFDSIGALLRESEASDKGKPAQGGQSGLITWGIKRIQMPAWKLHKTVILINQIRDDMDSMFNQVKPPGGHALEHTAEIHVHLRPDKDRYMIKEGTGVERHEVMVGRAIIAQVVRNKRNEGTNQRAYFDFYQKQTDEFPFGLDRVKDTVLTAKRVGAIRVGGAWHHHESFPTGKIQGYDNVVKFLNENPDVYDIVRSDTYRVIRPVGSDSIGLRVEGQNGASDEG